MTLTPKDQEKPTECPRCAHPWSAHVAGHGCTARVSIGDGVIGPECECSRTPEALTPKRQGSLTMHMQENGRVRVEIDGHVISECEHPDSAVTVCGPCVLALVSELAAERARTDALVRASDALLRFHGGDYTIQCEPVEEAIVAIQKARACVTPSSPGTHSKREETSE